MSPFIVYGNRLSCYRSLFFPKFVTISSSLMSGVYLTGVNASRHLIPVANSRCNIAAIRSTIMNASVILTSGCPTTCASWSIAGHVRLNALIGASLISSTGTEWAAWWTAVRPIFLFNLIVPTRIRIDIPGAAEWSTAGFDGTNATETSTVHLSHACLNEG